MLLDNFPTDFTYNVTEEPTAESTVGSTEGTFESTVESTLGTAESTEGTAESTEGTAESTEGTAESTEGTVESTEGTVESTEGTVESTEGTVESVVEEKIDDNYEWKQFDMKVKNLVVKDCKPDGNCQFRSIEQALYQYNNKYTHIKLRKLIGDYILSLKDKDFENILNNYKIEKDNGEFIGKWNPYKIKSKIDFVKNINTLGFHFEGDDTTLNILSKILNIDFIIINKNKSVTLKLNNGRAIIVLYYEKHGLSGHYKTIGLKKDNIISAFNSKSLPDEITELINIGKSRVVKTKSPEIVKTKSPVVVKTKLPEIVKTKSPVVVKTKSPKRRSTKRSKSKAKASKVVKTKSPKRRSTKRSKVVKTKSPKRRSKAKVSKAKVSKAKVSKAKVSKVVKTKSPKPSRVKK